MSNWAWLIILVLALTALGLTAIGLITKHFYWGSRGTPPLTSEQRRILNEERTRAAKKK